MDTKLSCQYHLLRQMLDGHLSGTMVTKTRDSLTRCLFIRILMATSCNINRSVYVGPHTWEPYVPNSLTHRLDPCQHLVVIEWLEMCGRGCLVSKQAGGNRIRDCSGCWSSILLHVTNAVEHIMIQFDPNAFFRFHHCMSSSLSPVMNLPIATELRLQASNHVRCHQNMYSNIPCVPSCSNVVLADVHPSILPESRTSLGAVTFVCRIALDLL